MLLQLPEGGKGDTPGSQLKGGPKFAKGGRGTKGIIQKNNINDGMRNFLDLNFTRVLVLIFNLNLTDVCSEKCFNISFKYPENFLILPPPPPPLWSSKRYGPSVNSFHPLASYCLRLFLYIFTKNKYCRRHLKESASYTRK